MEGVVFLIRLDSSLLGRRALESGLYDGSGNPDSSLGSEF